MTTTNANHEYPRGRDVRNCDCEKNEIVNTVGKQVTTLAGIRGDLLIEKAG